METGQIIGRYELGESLLGREYYDLWQATDPSLPSVKVSIKSYHGEEQATQILWREIMVLRRLEHPSAPKLRHLIHQDGIHLVLDPRRGKPLLQWTEEQNGMDLQRAAHVLFPLLEVMDHCHSHGVLINELSLEDLYILQTGRLQLGALEGATLLKHHEELSLTPPQHLGVTRHMLAPELVSGNLADARADLWRFGALMLELLNGPGAFFGQVMSATVDNDAYPGDLQGPDGLQELYARLVARDPDDRPASAAAVSEELAGVLGKKRWERMVVVPAGPATDRGEKPLYCPTCLAALSSGFEKHHRCEECGQTWDPETSPCTWCGGPRFAGAFCACCCHPTAVDQAVEPIEIHPDDLQEVGTEGTNPAVDDDDQLMTSAEPIQEDESGPILLTTPKRPKELDHSTLQEIINDSGPHLPITQRETGPLVAVEQKPRVVVQTSKAVTTDKAGDADTDENKPVEAPRKSPSIHERETGPLTEVPTGQVMPIQQRETGPLHEVETGQVIHAAQDEDPGLPEEPPLQGSTGPFEAVDIGLVAPIHQRETGPLREVDTDTDALLRQHDDMDEEETGQLMLPALVAPAGAEVRCPRCRGQNPRGVEFCMGCGERLVEDVAPAPPPPAPEPEPASPEDAALPEPHINDLMPPAEDSPTMVFGREPSGSHEPLREPIEALVLGSPDAPELPLLPVGAMLSERWEVTRQLGHGSFARAYLVQDGSSYLHRELAVKVPLRKLEADVLERGLLHQYRVWKVLGNQEPDCFTRLERVERLEVNGVATVGVFVERMPGGSLQTFLKRRPLDRVTFARVMTAFRLACLAVERLHQQGLLHRNIKPGNLLLDSAGRQCKLTDFELAVPQETPTKFPGKLLEPGYTAPECKDGAFTVQSDLYSLGATLYHLLGGKIPDDGPPFPPPLQELNPLVTADLDLMIMRCLSPTPGERPADAEALADAVEHHGLAEPGAGQAPGTLARLLHAHLAAEDLDYLAETLRARGYQLSDRGTIEDLLKEYCYTESPADVLAHNCTRPQLARLAEALGIDAAPTVGTEEVIGQVLWAAGFLPGERQVPGIQQTRSTLSHQLHDLTRASTAAECMALLSTGLAAVERMIGLQVLFFSQVVHGPGGFRHLVVPEDESRRVRLRDKVRVLSELCLNPPSAPMGGRMQRGLRWPLLEAEILEQLEQLVRERRRLRRAPETKLAEASRKARALLNTALEVVELITGSPHCPRVVQVVSRHDDLHGRRFYLGRDEHGQVERIFTPQLLEVGQVYLCHALTSPGRVEPLLFRLDLPE